MRGREIFGKNQALEKMAADLQCQNEALKKAMAQIKVLKEFLPICSECKKIRDEEGEWHQLETYISNHCDTRFSHGICPSCVTILYPELKKQK